MTQEDKDLLLKDLCARLPYGVIGAVLHYDELGCCAYLQGKIKCIIGDYCRFVYLPECTDDVGTYNDFCVDEVKPYLRPMSSMTEEEIKELGEVTLKGKFQGGIFGMLCPTYAPFDWLNAHHFDYRGLIQQGLAIEVTEYNNPYK